MSTIKFSMPPKNDEYVAKVLGVRERGAGSGRAYDFDFEISEGEFKSQIIRGSLTPYESYKLPEWLKAIMGSEFPEGSELEVNNDLLVGKQVRAKFSNPKVRALFPI